MINLREGTMRKGVLKLPALSVIFIAIICYVMLGYRFKMLLDPGFIIGGCILAVFITLFSLVALEDAEILIYEAMVDDPDDLLSLDNIMYDKYPKKDFDVHYRVYNSGEVIYIITRIESPSSAYKFLLDHPKFTVKMTKFQTSLI